MSKIQSLVDKPQTEIKRLNKLLEQQQRQIDRLRGMKRTAFGKALTRSRKQGFVRIVFGDIHGSYLDAQAVSAFLEDVRLLKPAELICVGDLLDCAGFLAEHHTIGVVPQLDYTYEHDSGAANDFLDSLAKASGNAPCTVLEGNHEARIQRWIAKATIRNVADARMLERMYGAAAVLKLEDRNIRWIRRHEIYDDLSIHGTIRLRPGAVAQHGEAYCGVNATRQLLQALGKNVFHGHTHRLCAIYGENLASDLVGVNTGCLCQKRPLYGLTKTTGWMHGYAVQFVQPGQGFLAIPVPIVGGVSYLAPLLALLKRK